MPLSQQLDSQMEIKFKLIDNSEIEIILPLLHELDPTIPKHLLSSRLTAMIELGYECVGIYINKKLIGICGIWTLVKYYIGKHIEPDNVFIKEKYRHLGVGTQLNDWLKTFALSRNCRSIELNCYIKNEKGNHFWGLNEYIPIGLHYQKKLFKKS